MDFKLYDAVILKEPLLSNKQVRPGSLGAIVEILETGVFLVEFADKNGVAYAVETLKAGQILKFYEEPALA